MIAPRYLAWVSFSQVVLLMLPVILHAQSRLCRGSLGDNIFEEGDFGSGHRIAPFDDPGLAPGYMYSVYAPLRDGQYTITNSLARGGDWPSWLRIGDNSDDPFGYMMVVNASYEPGVFYDKVIDGVCDNTMYEFSADVINVIRREERGHLFPDVSFLIDGVERYTTGWIQQDEKWRKVGFTFQTASGQSQIRLTLRNNAAGGYGNDIALDNISFRACGPMATIHTSYPNVSCEGSDPPVLSVDVWDGSERVVQWQMSADRGKSWSNISGETTIRYKVGKQTPGKYQYRFVHAATQAQLRSPKCRSVSDIFELEVLPAVIRRTVTINAGEVYRLGGKSYQTSGTYRAVFETATGCDSTVIVDLRVRGDQISAKIAARDVRCHGGSDGVARIIDQSGGVAPFSYRWSNGDHGKQTQGLVSGTYEVTITDARGVSLVSSTTVGQPSDITIELAFKSGDVTASVRGGVSPYHYVWSDRSSGLRVDQPDPGVLSLTVTDGQGCSAVEQMRVREPETDPEDVPAFTMESLGGGRAVRLDRVQFEADSSRVNSGSLPTLRALLSFLKQHPGITVEIGGHTNGLPEHSYCDSLSTARARSIAEWLVKNGARDVSVTYKGYGKRQPIATNETPDGRRRNQRVEVRVVER